MRLEPSTLLGELAIVALLGFATGLGMLFAATIAGEQDVATLPGNWLLTGPLILAALSGIAALPLGLVAARDGERAVSVFLAVLVGLVVMLWVGMKISVP